MPTVVPHYGPKVDFAPQFQSIDSAPRDGTIIIGLYWDVPNSHRESKGKVVRCWFQPEFDAFISDCRMMTLAEGYSFDDGSSTQLHSPSIELVSHWLPFNPPT
jgi:hypothetical protein